MGAYKQTPIIPQGGLSIEDAHEKLEEVSKDFLENCDAILINVGSCDFPIRTDREMEDNYANFVDLLNSINSSCPQANILLYRILPRSGEGKVKVNKQTFNQRFIELCQAEQQIEYINNDGHFTDESGVISALFASNDVTGIHVHNDGQLSLASNIQDALKGICFKGNMQNEWDIT